MRKLVKLLFGKIIREEAHKIEIDRMKNRVSEFSEQLKKTPTDCRINVIDLTEDISISESLGITEEMKKRLEKKLSDVMTRNCTTTEKMEEYSAVCKHPNQLAYLSFMHGAYNTHRTESMIAGGDGGSLAMMAILASLIKKQKGGEE